MMEHFFLLECVLREKKIILRIMRSLNTDIWNFKENMQVKNI